MKLKPIQPNMTELQTFSGAIILFSYSNPVALRNISGEYARTGQYYSPTTSKHIHLWLKDIRPQILNKNDFEAMVNTLLAAGV